MTRDERQTQALKSCGNSGFKGTVLGATGFGKTRVGLRAIKWFLSKNPEAVVMVVVPTTYLKTQWEGLLKEWDFSSIKVWVIN